MNRPTPLAMPVNPNATINGLAPNPNLYAVIINGADQDRYWNDISAIYCTLLDVYGYTKENIFVHYVNGSSGFGNDFDNDGAGDIDYDAYKTTIHHTFQEMSGETNTSPEIKKLGPEDGLFIFVDDHGYMSGGHSYINLPGDDLGDFEMAEYLEDINCAQIIAILEPCQIGGFKVELSDYVNYDVSCKNRSIHTASNDESSWAEVWITGANYDEFVYYWTAAARGYYPHNDYPWEESYEVGSFPFNNYPELVGHPGDIDPDLNGDGFVQMEEAFFYANFMDTWSPFGYWYPYYSDVEENPQEFTDISFNEDLLSLCGIGGHVVSTQTIENRNYLIGGDLIIDNGYNLTLGNSGGYYLGNENANIIVENSATLIAGSYVGFSGNTSNKIIVNGDIQVGNNVHFKRLGSSGYFAGLHIINQNTNTILNQVTFTKARMRNYGNSLIVNDCDFDDCFIVFSHRGSVTFTNSDFDRTWLYLENINANNYAATVADCNFTTDFNLHAIDLWNYDNFRIENNTISGYYNGIQLCQSGDGNILNYHHIHNNEISDCIMAGITIYDSKVSISQNNVHDNRYGIRLNNNSNTALYGAYNAPSYDEMNQITDNDSYELYISKYSYPWYFRYNAIIDEDNAGNPSDPLLYFAYPGIGNINQKDIRYNCWGDNFDAVEDLYPSTYFYYTPTWCPGGSPIPIDEAEQLYTDGVEQFEAEQYTESKETFLLLIDQFPKTQYAVSAMKELVVLEKFASNDYATLKNYYQTDDGIQTDTTLQKLASSLSNKCDIKLENWPEAINHYENIILAPKTFEDSIFAIIDLGYVYFLMENDGNKSTYSGQLTEFIPKSKEGFFGHRDYLLSLLPGDQMSETMKGDIATLKEGELLQNVPNPFNGTTQIWYKLKTESNVQLKVYNSTGQLISTINEGPKTTGTHHINFDATGLKNGIYFYTISINGQTTDSKKMTIIK